MATSTALHPSWFHCWAGGQRLWAVAGLATLITWGNPISPAAELELASDAVTVRTDSLQGGAITWISLPNTGNLVNSAAPGRLIQPSFHAGRGLDRTGAGQSRSWTPWSWCPSQSGSFNGTRSVVDAFFDRKGTLYSWTRPKLWDMPNETAAAALKQWTTLEPGLPGAVRVTNQLVCARPPDDAWGPARPHQQAVPGAWLIRSLQNLLAYQGGNRWSQISCPAPTTLGPCRADVPRNVLACLDDSGQGLAFYSPAADGWQIGVTGTSPTSNPAAHDALHIAPTVTVALAPDSTFTFRYWILAGNSQSIAAMADRLIRIYPDQ